MEKFWYGKCSGCGEMIAEERDEVGRVEVAKDETVRRWCRYCEEDAAGEVA